jgi:hypothetical protein
VNERSRKIGAVALGAVAIGALAAGAVALGILAIGRLAIGRARIGRLEIDELIVRKSHCASDHPLRRAGLAQERRFGTAAALPMRRSFV